MIVNYDFYIEDTKDGLKILKIHKENKKIYIGSKYKMKDVLDKLLYEDEKIEDDSIVILFGIGSGEYIKRLYNKKKNIKIIIFEPNIKLVKYIKNTTAEEYDFLNNENIYLLNAKNEDEVYKSLKNLIREFEINKIIYRYLLNYDNIFSEQILKFNKVVKSFIEDMVINSNTSMIFCERWFYTLLNNLKYMIDSNPIQLLKDKYKNIPAIVVSAGPSLNKNIDELKRIDNDIVILSGGRTLKPLVEKKILPSLIGVVDPGVASYNLVKGYIEKTDVPLLFYEGTNEEVVKKHSGKKFIFTENNMIKDIFEMDIESLGSGGSIAHILTSTAILLGCNPIIFIGQDLAYTGEKYHADLAISQVHNSEDNKVKVDSEYIYVEDIYGDKVRTSKVLDNFRRELENIISKNDKITFINATEGGARIKGTYQMTLREAIVKYKVKEKINIFKELVKVDKYKVKNKTIEDLQQVIDQDEEIIKQCKKALKIVENLKIYIATKQKSKINKSLIELNIIDDKIKQSYEKLDILKTIIYPIIYNILSGKTPKNDKEIMEVNNFLYQSILNVSEHVLQPIKNTKIIIENIEYDNKKR